MSKLLSWFLTLMAGPILLVASPATLLAAEAGQPNVLLILTDDQGWPTLGCYGGEHVATPHLDRLAAEGVRFTDAYVTSQCTPTRASLLTGQYTARHGLWHVLAWYGYPWARMTEPPFAENFPRSTHTLAKGLQSAGYATGIMGKWHLTSNADGDYRGLRPAASHHYGFDFAPPILSSEEFEPGADRGVNTLTTQAIEFIDQHRQQPWFCFLSHHMIHGKVVAPEELTQKYRARGYNDQGPHRAVYLAGLETIDQSIGRLIAALDRMEEADHTIVIFLSDNGGIDLRYDFRQLPSPPPPQPSFPVDMREYDNAPLRAGKGSCYEGGVRVPMIVRWPDQVQAGTTSTTPVHAIDILPTLYELAGVELEEEVTFDGRSLRKLLTDGHDRQLAERAIYQYYPFYDLRWGLTPCASIRQGKYKLIEFFGDRVDREGTYQPGQRIELYDLEQDLGETTNLAESHRRLAGELRQQLSAWMTRLEAKASVRNPHVEADRRFEETREKPSWLK